MKAVRLYGAMDLRVGEVAEPSAPPPGFVNLEVRAAGICGSDLHNYRTGQWISRRPSTAGHEFCGRVTAIGEGVSHVVRGDVVSADSRMWCGTCPACTSGRSNVCETLGFVGEICDGGFAEAVQLPARLVVRHDPQLSPHVAAMAEPLAVALHAVRRLAIPAGEPVLVIGCGTIGGLSALLLSRLHDGPLLLGDLNADKAALVAEVTGGAVVALDRAVVEAALSGGRVRYALDATGSIQAIARALDILSGGGALALVGIGHGKLDFDPNIIVEREISLVGCHAFAGELPEAIELLADLAPALQRFIEVLPALDDVPEAYERLLRGESKALKTIIEVAG
ncbi:zinc-dependent alcohol dehydrogenase [Sinorhizobium meliloti]|uniref:zinc-dependent alcohol dehydrogenase n=1 Tax=Rhizobium meliloti TaxID=382 RepID=UPI000B49A92E|nr:zinc-binding dehydrogenase [Sinorhizobium meliloti]ASP86838.1 dehydrogenase [Sinorhizobium meliloti]ASP93375.1 dehydrogenase [Sinorhizobium meliloti]MQW25510.1 alcohol dehydrogenase catalytic domain-containing protein [Sinorhizobium meliloti]MQX59943.1 alcohol dehydrogenase catalytic domain-containing protein [Sinorhizobium meliloti]RVJ47844.1 dehydrogenase [Sinorhizobium meliloti]